MTGPTWLVATLAAVMIATAAYCLGHLVASWVHQRTAEHDVAMGVAMAAMLVADLGGHWNSRWALGFVVLAAWFACRTVRAVAHHGAWSRGIAHPQHVLACGAMTYMLVGIAAPAQAASSAPAMDESMPGMAGMGAGAARDSAPPAVAVLLAVVLLCYAGWNVAQLVVAPLGPGSPDRPLAPRVAIGCQLVMSITMAHLLIAA